MPMPEFFHGIDIGGTKMELVTCDADMQVRYRQRIATPTQDYAQFFAAVTGLIERADQACQQRAPVGLGIPGIIDVASGTHLSANVACLTGQRLLPRLQDALQREVYLGNDCQCFALSEAHGGAAHGAASMFGLIIGTGAGAGYVLNGQLVRGRSGIAGEWGHWPVGPDLLQRYDLPALPCQCGRQACLERYVSGRGLHALHARLSHSEGKPAEALLLASHDHDPLARSVFEIHLDLLASAIAQITLAYDPHIIVLGGGLSALEHLYARLPAAIAPHLFPGISAPPIVPPRFGAAGGARGAALLAARARPHI